MKARRDGRAIPCKVVCNTRSGYLATPHDAPSIAAGVRMGKESGWFRYRVFVGGRCVRQGFCE